MLYHFISERFGLEAIRNRRLKISLIQELNDPFEFLGLALEKAERRVLRDFKNKFADRFGLICMSSSWRNPLLWGHYADKHKGLCLGFDVPDEETFIEVTYKEKRPTLQEFGCAHLRQFQEHHMLRLLTMKFDAWKYESEYRAFCDLKDKDPVSGHFFTSFSQNMNLRRVIVGERSTVTRNQLVDDLGDLRDSVVAFKARPGFQQFEVVENMRKEAWK